MADKSNYYHNSAYVLRILRYAVTFLFIIFLISCIVIFRKDITIENIQLLAKFISFDSSASDYTEEFTITANEDSDIVMLRNNLGIINHNNISLCDLSGQKLFSYNFSLSSPAVVHDDHSIIVYDINGNSLTLFNSFSKIKDFKYKGNVLAADVNDDYFTVITDDDSYNSLLKVYAYSYHERDYIETFTLKSTDYLTSCGISHNGRFVVSSSVDATEGSFLSKIQIYDTSSKSTTPLYSHVINNEMPIKVGFSEDNQNAFVITDSAIHFFNNRLEAVSSHKFNQSKIQNFYDDDSMIILSERNNLSGNSVLLTGISKSGDVIFENNISDELYDVCIGNEKIFALGKQRVYEFSSEKDSLYSVVKEAELDSKYFSIICDTEDNCYVLSDSYVKRITF